MSLAPKGLAYGSGASTARRWSARRSPLDDVMSRVPTRRYDVAWLDDEGKASSLARVAPAVPIFEEAFSAFSRGALIATPQGPTAVEDLTPGDMVETDAGPVPLLWIGAITMMPDTGHGPSRGQRLFRVTADAFGLDRPMPDLVLGPAARVLSGAPAIQRVAHAAAALAPIRSFADGSAVFEVAPVSPVRVFHLGFRGHRILRANGVELESFHPGQLAMGRLGPEMTSTFLSLFPHVRTLSGFGRLCAPRLSDDDLEQLLMD